MVYDLTNGEILALSSFPDFDPSLFVGESMPPPSLH